MREITTAASWRGKKKKERTWGLRCDYNNNTQQQHQEDHLEQRPQRPRPRPRPSSSGPASAYSASDLKRESVRRRTFAGWSVPYISPADLARAGFIYTGSRDCVRCVFCG